MMKKIYAFLLFILSFSTLHSQSTICDNATPICGNVNPTLNTTNTPSLGSIGCLASTPNPNWFIFKVGFTGNLNYNLHQGSNAPLYNNQDIDFICWGPFTTPPDCNTQLYGYPAGNTSIPNNVVACSYSSSPTETFTIPNADSNKYYVILTTNFSNNAGLFVLEQTNENSAGAGSTDCSAVCGLFLGTSSNQEILVSSTTFCGPTSCDLKCVFRAPNVIPLTYKWYFNDVLQTALTTQQITVTQTGVWKVVATNPNCNLPSEDSIDITFGNMPEINNVPYSVNGPTNDCYPVFNLKNQDTFILNGLNTNDYSVQYFSNEFDSWDGVNPIANPQTFAINQNTIIYVRVTDIASSCFDNTSFTLDIDCANTELIITTQPQNQTINSNDTVVFTTNITNAIAYVWQMSTDGINWTSITNGGSNPTFSGANTNTLTINSVPANYNGNMFRVMATSATDMKISNPANLAIALSNDNYYLNQFSIFPNPTINNFTLHINKKDLTEDLKFSIYDLNGRKLFENKITTLETIIPFEKYQSGIYLFEISTNEIKSVKKIIKN